MRPDPLPTPPSAPAISFVSSLHWPLATTHYSLPTAAYCSDCQSQRVQPRIVLCAFDAVVCFRLLMHVPDWRVSIRELCREQNILPEAALKSALDPWSMTEPHE